MKRSKLPSQLAKNVSKLHKYVGELLISEESPYKFYEIRQEYRVSEVNCNYKSNREKFDWAILNLKVVIEIMGKQHFEVVRFGGMPQEQAIRNFKRRLYLDKKKQDAAERAGWAYVTVRYDEMGIGIGKLTSRITEALESVSEDIEELTKQKIKIPTRKKYNWPTKKIPSKPFGGNKEWKVDKKL